MPAQCPSPEVLEAIAAGAEVDEAARAHADGCDTCRTAVHRLREDNALLGRVAKAHSPAGEGPRAPKRTVPHAALIPGYLLQDEIHRGGQGVVFRAVQVATNRPVAIKMLLGGALATGRQRRRFEREIEVVAGLRHPGIVTVYESGMTPDGRVYLAMEYIDGQPLDRAAPGRPADAGAVRGRLRLIARVCEAVHYAHQRGVIHRDLKPGNILVDREGGPHVVDFGLAKGAAERAELAAMTRSGEFLGTVAYASPEQVAGSPDGVGTLSDVYSLGVVLYELLTGVTPYPVEGPLAETVRHIATTEPKAPSALNRAVGGEAETIVLKALSKERGRRYTSARALGADIEACLAGHAIQARRDSTMYVLRKAVRRHKWAFSAGAAAVVALAGVAVTTTVLYAQKSAAEALAQRRARTSHRAEVFIAEVLSGMQPARWGASESGEAGFELGTDVTVRVLLDHAAERIDADFAAEPELAASLHHVVGRSYAGIGENALAVGHLERSLALHERLGEDDPAALADVVLHLAWALVELSRAEEAVPLAKRAVELGQRAGPAMGPDDRTRGLLVMALALHGAGRTDEAADRFAAAAAACADGPGRNDSLFARVTCQHAVVLRGSRPEAMAVLRAAAEDLEQRGGDPVALAMVQIEICRTGAHSLGPRERVDRLHRAAMLCRDIPRAAAEITLARALGELCKEHLAAGDTTLAEPLAAESLELRRKVMGPTHVRYAEGLLTMMLVRLAQGRVAEAETLSAEAVAIMERSVGPDNGMLKKAVGERARVLRMLQREEEARSLVERPPNGETASQPPRTAFSAAMSRLRDGDAAGAESGFRAFVDAGAVDGIPRWMPEMARAGLGRALWLQGRAEEALPYLEAALGALRGYPDGAMGRAGEVAIWTAEVFESRGRTEEAASLREYAETVRPEPGRRPPRPPPP